MDKFIEIHCSCFWSSIFVTCNELQWLGFINVTLFTGEKIVYVAQFCLFELLLSIQVGSPKGPKT